jgi:hypothetical protein
MLTWSVYDDAFHAEAAPRMTKTVLVCEAQVPFVQGSAELLVHRLVAELTRRGYRARKVSVPFNKWYPKGELLAQAAAWRLIDLSEANGVRIDTVIATKFPTLLRPPPERGHLAAASVPRDLRAVRHALGRGRGSTHG